MNIEALEQKKKELEQQFETVKQTIKDNESEMYRLQGEWRFVESQIQAQTTSAPDPESTTMNAEPTEGEVIHG